MSDWGQVCFDLANGVDGAESRLDAAAERDAARLTQIAFETLMVPEGEQKDALRFEANQLHVALIVYQAFREGFTRTLGTPEKRRRGMR